MSQVVVESRVRSGFAQCKKYGAQHNYGRDINLSAFVSPISNISLLFLIIIIIIIIIAQMLCTALIFHISSVALNSVSVPLH